MKSFNHFSEQAETSASEMNQPKRLSEDLMVTFGRHNPPHAGHGRTFDQAHDLANNVGDKAPADQRFYTSKSQDPKKNPLPWQMKIKFMEQMFPKHAQKWDKDENVRTILDTASKGHKEGYKNLHFVGGEDRKQGMEDLLRKYNGQLYNFDNIYSHSAGDRAEDPEDPIAGLSASKLRNFAQGNDLESFKEMIQVNEKGFDPKELFDAVRLFGQKNEEVDVRELYATDKIYRLGEVVESLYSGLMGTVHRRGANHLICVTEDGIMFKEFIHNVYSK